MEGLGTHCLEVRIIHAIAITIVAPVVTKNEKLLDYPHVETMRPLKNAQFWSGSRKAIILTTGIYSIFRGLKFEPDADIGQISADFERGRFAKVSPYGKG